MFMARSTISRADSLRVLEQCLGGRLGVPAARADGGAGLVGLDHVAIATEDVGVVQIGDQQQRLEVPQHLVGAPVLGHLHGTAGQVAVELLEFGFKTGEQTERVGSRAGEPGEDGVLVQAAELVGAGLEHLATDGDLAVAGNHNLAVAAHNQNCGAMDCRIHKSADYSSVTKGALGLAESGGRRAADGRGSDRAWSAVGGNNRGVSWSFWTGRRSGVGAASEYVPLDCH